MNAVDSTPCPPSAHRHFWVAALLLLVLALGFGVSVRAALIHARTHQTHDEAISYLAAAGKQVSYHEAVQQAPAPRWLPAADLQSYSQPDDAFVFGRIRDGLARSDVHPPLYFWLLHAWLLLVGAGIHAGPFLNLVVFASTALALFLLARRWLGNGLEAAAVVLLYAVSSRACQASIEARPYELYAFFVVYLALSLTLLMDPENTGRVRAAAFVALALLGGMLTHYQFALVAAGGVSIAGIWMLRWRDRRILSLGAALLASGAIWFLLTPDPLGAIARFRAQSGGFESTEFAERLERAWQSLARFLANDPLWLLPATLQGRIWMLPLMLVAGVLAVLASEAIVGRHRGRPMFFRKPRREGTVQAASLVVVTLAAVYGMYLMQTRSLSSIDPPRYNLIAGVGLAFVPVLAVRVLRPVFAASVLAVLAVFMAASTLYDASRPVPGTWQVPAVLQEAPRVVVGSVDRGVLPPILHPVPAGTQVYAAPLAMLAEAPGDWLDDLEPGDAFVAHISYANTMAEYERVLALIRERFAVEGQWAFSQGYLVHRLYTLEAARNLGALPWQRFMSQP